MTERLEKEDYYFDPNGLMVFTEAYHLKRGYCCNSGCRHCPYHKTGQGDLKVESSDTSTK